MTAGARPGRRRADYDGSAEGWAGGASLVYEPLAAALVQRALRALSGAAALDVGAGTGAASRALSAAGARPLAVDVSFDMLRHDRSRRPPSAMGDVLRLPFRSGCFDAVVAAFCLNHLTDPVAGLREMGRVAAPGAVVLASTFSTRSRLPARDRVDEVAARFGWRVPAWYARVREEVEPLLGSAEAFADAAHRAGLGSVRAEEEAVEVGVASPAEVVAYRLGQAPFVDFLRDLDGSQRARLVTEAEAAVGDGPTPLRPVVVFLSALT